MPATFPGAAISVKMVKQAQYGPIYLVCVSLPRTYATRARWRARGGETWGSEGDASLTITKQQSHLRVYGKERSAKHLHADPESMVWDPCYSGWL